MFDWILNTSLALYKIQCKTELEIIYVFIISVYISLYISLRLLQIFLGTHYAKSVQIWSFSGQYFPVFGLNVGKYLLEKTPYLDTFNAVTWFALFVRTIFNDQVM